MDKYFYIREENDIVLFDNVEGLNPYNVVSRVVDPSNAYELEEVKIYCQAHPEKALEVDPAVIPEPTEDELLRAEEDRLKQYLSDTDYGVIKCQELGLVYAEEYPDVAIARANARTRINEIEALL